MLRRLLDTVRGLRRSGTASPWRSPKRSRHSFSRRSNAVHSMPQWLVRSWRTHWHRHALTVCLGVVRLLGVELVARAALENFRPAT